MNLRSCFDNFNPSRFFVFSMMSIFTLLISMKADGVIDWSFWIVFLPLWFWKLTVVMGFISGTIAWCYHPRGHYHSEAHFQYKAMAISTVYQIILLFFEILACDRLENSRNKWIVIFIPLLLLSFFGIGVCIWAMKHDQTFELELLLSVNVLLFIFIALKLDNLVLWSWAVVFIPLWTLMSVAIVFELYGLMLVLILCKSPDLMPEQRKHTIYVTTGYALVIFPILVFEILLSKKLDNELDEPYMVVASPLLVAFFVLIVMSFLIRGDNPWWFGIRRPLCQLLLEMCEPLQQYGNISYHVKHTWRSLPPDTGEHISREMQVANYAQYLEVVDRDQVPRVVETVSPPFTVADGDREDVRHTILHLPPLSTFNQSSTENADIPTANQPLLRGQNQSPEPHFYRIMSPD